MRITRHQLRRIIKEQIENDLLQEGMFQDAMDWIKKKGTAAKDSVVGFLTKFKAELEETTAGVKILAKIVQGEDLTSEEKTGLKTQVIDIGKGLPLLTLIALPGGGIATVVLLKLAKKFGINLMPTAFQEKAVQESVVHEYIKALLTEQEVKYQGILKLMPTPEIVSNVSSLLQQLPPEAVPLPEDKFHVTLAHQSVLKPYKKQFKQLSKEGMLPPPPPVVLDVIVEERTDEELGRKSWVVWASNQADLKAYVQNVIQLVGGPPGDPEPSRRFHISIANLTGNPGDSVR